VAAVDDKTIVELHLSGGECHDAPEGGKSLNTIGTNYPGVPVLMDRAYEGSETRELAKHNGHDPVVPPKINRKDPWEYDKTLYKRRNIVERFFRRIKEYRRIFTRYDKLDQQLLAYIHFAIICIWLR
jgi:transposase